MSCSVGLVLQNTWGELVWHKFLFIYEPHTIKELGTEGPLFRLKIGEPPVPVVGVAAAATAVQNNAENRTVSFILSVITSQG
jgi:hypothetical protein